MTKNRHRQKDAEQGEEIAGQLVDSFLLLLKAAKKERKSVLLNWDARRISVVTSALPAFVLYLSRIILQLSLLRAAKCEIMKQRN